MTTNASRPLDDRIYIRVDAIDKARMAQAAVRAGHRSASDWARVVLLAALNDRANTNKTTEIE